MDTGRRPRKRTATAFGALATLGTLSACSGNDDAANLASPDEASATDASRDRPDAGGGSDDSRDAPSEASADGSSRANDAGDARVDELADSDNDAGDARVDELVDSDATTGCAPQATAAMFAGGARSAGFGGSGAAYDALYGVSCQAPGDCASACESAGGTSASCTAGSACVPGPDPDGGSMCLPPPYWINASAALSQSATTTNAAEITLTDASLSDALVMTSFGISVPDGAVIRGIQFDVRLSADSGLAEDGTIQAVRAGVVVGANRARTGAWPTTLTYETYGGPNDDWGLAWTPADVRSADFGISIVPRYTDTGGNDRAHVDAVRATVFYSTACD